MEPVLAALKEDTSDHEMTLFAIEMFRTLLTPSSDPPTPEDMGVMFSEMFAKTPENLGVLLQALEENNFQVRLATAQLLKVLLRNCPSKTQENILMIPQGTGRIMDLLSGTHEAIRNEALLLLVDLTKENPQIQKILAFDDAFSKLLNIIVEESMSEGEIVVRFLFDRSFNANTFNVSQP